MMNSRRFVRPGPLNRREFLAVTGSAGLGGLIGSRARAQTPVSEDMDLIVHNAKVYTVDRSNPVAQSFAVKNGRFAAIGTSAEIRGLAGKKTQSYDAKGMTVLPGFIDTHNHGMGELLLYSVLVGNPYDVEFVTIDSIIGKLQERARTLPPGTWVEGYFHDDTKIKDKRPLNVRDLDKVSAEHPVSVRHRGWHTVFYNSKAFQMAGVTKNTPNPFGGTYDKDERGDLNGRVTDLAIATINNSGDRQKFDPVEKARRTREGVAFISQKFVQYGLTTVHHNEPDVLVAMQEQRANGKLLHRVSYEADSDVLEAMIKGGFQSGFGDEFLSLGATAEHVVDGSFSERTMAISTPYKDISPPYYGNLTESQADLNAWTERVHRAGIRLNCHANGDVAIDRVLTAYERALKLYPRANPRPKITHCSLLNERLIARMKAINAVPAEFSTYAYYNADKFHFYGEEMMQHMTPYRSLIDAGITVAGGSDFPPGPFSPLMAMQGMVTRTGWNGETWGGKQRISVDEAISVNTINGAYNSCEEKIKGSISIGKVADFVVLADDPHTVAPEKLKDIKIVQTVVYGKVVYHA